MRATIKDIARETHLSPSTVSLVLNNKPHRLSEETRKRVLETAKRLDYRPNRMAASLVTNRTRTIGIVVADIKNAYFAELASGAEAKCTDMGYSLIICNTNDQREKDFDYINLMIDRGVDGIIISFSAGVEEETAQKVTAYVRKFGIRAVAIDYMTDFSHVMNVRLDNKLGGYLATKHLIDLGHRRVGCITGPINNDTCTANLRLLGYKSALREAGISRSFFADSSIHACLFRSLLLRLLSFDFSLCIFLAQAGQYFDMPERGTYSTPHTVQFLGFNAVHRFVGVICNSPTKPMNL